MNTINPYHKPHNSFVLNGISYDLMTIREFAYSQIQQGDVDGVNLGQFILDWTDDKRTITVQTSGTTSNPSLLELPKSTMVNSAKSTALFFNLNPGNTALCCLPFSYIAAKMMFVRSWILGLSLDVVKPSTSPLKNLSKPYDFSAMVPLQASHSIEKLNQIKTLLIGGAPVPVSLKNDLKKTSVSVYETYGMTETASHIAIKNLTKGESAFTVLPNISIETDTNDCLLVSAPQLSDDILHTKDVVSIISDREFIWLGRFDNVINSGGIKIYPEQLETLLENQIQQRFIITSVSDEFYGQKTIMIIEGNEKDFSVDLSIIDPKKRPKHIYFLADFPETESGKIKRLETLKALNLNNP